MATLIMSAIPWTWFRSTSAKVYLMEGSLPQNMRGCFLRVSCSGYPSVCMSLSSAMFQQSMFSNRVFRLLIFALGSGLHPRGPAVSCDAGCGEGTVRGHEQRRDYRAGQRLQGYHGERSALKLMWFGSYHQRRWFRRRVCHQRTKRYGRAYEVSLL